MIDVPTVFAWLVLAILFLAFVAAIVYLGSLPGNIARKRNHPQADAITAASWVGIALLGAGWPIAFVWAFLKQAPAGSPPEATTGQDEPACSETDAEIRRLSERLSAIESRLASEEQTRED